VRAAFDRIDFQVSVQSRRFGSRTQQRYQRLRHSSQQQESIASHDFTDVCGLEAHAKVQILLVAKGLGCGSICAMT
jgi:hypothetical protein